MSRKNIKTGLFLILGFVFIYIIYDSVSQPNVSDLRGEFKEAAVYRNENNTGPIMRIYAVTLTDTLWEEMKKYGDLMPYTKYGTTKVYFFKNGSPVPKQLTPGNNNFDTSLKQYVLGEYYKDANGQVSFTKNM